MQSQIEPYAVTDAAATPHRLAWQPIAKRALDIVVSALALLLLAPLLLLIALIVRLQSPGPALFRQQRVGRGEKLFTCLKFRSMVDGADARVHREAFARMVRGGTMSDDPSMPYKLANDRRVTRVGALLRKTSLDELPQLINVLRGDMSLVGPRPSIPYELELYRPEQRRRHLVQPGITGLWQVYGRGRVGVEEMLALDVRYAVGWTIWLDLKLLALTIPAVLHQRGAR